MDTCDLIGGDVFATIVVGENGELERALVPRDIDFSAFAFAVKDIPHVPLFVSSLDEEESKKTAQSLATAFVAIKFPASPQWQVAHFPFGTTYSEGITVEYEFSFFEDSEDNPNVSHKVAVSVCEELKSEGLAASVISIPINTSPVPGNRSPFAKDWPPSAPSNAVVIRVGSKPERFWFDRIAKEKGQIPFSRSDFCTEKEFFDWAKQVIAARKQIVTKP